MSMPALSGTGTGYRTWKSDRPYASRWVAFLVPAICMKRWAKSRRLRVQKGDSLPFEVRKIKLLVDGDHFGCSQIRDAVAFLAEKSTHLHTLIYAAPGRINNKKMRVLLQQPDISFVPVPRSKNHAAEPNDDAIIAEMLESAKSPSSECIALLTNDKGFASAIKDVIPRSGNFSFSCPIGVHQW